MSSASSALAASFRDPSGFVYRRDGVLYRQVNGQYQADYEHLMASGLYKELGEADLLVPHEEVALDLAHDAAAYKVLQPEPLRFISYPYEWSFSQLKDAALTLLEVQQRAFEHGMTLKDATAYNIQFHRGQPLFIDTLSFERYREEEPWVAYRQFCQHFLAPLALMSQKDIRLGQLLRLHIDGIPLDLAASLLPLRSRLKLPLLLHIHFHASSQKRYAGQGLTSEHKAKQFGRTSFLGLLDGLHSAINDLQWNPRQTDWSTYYGEMDHYSVEAVQQKKEVVADFLNRAEATTVWDMGANTGEYSRLATTQGRDTIAFDFDPGAVELNYRSVKESGEEKLLPLLLDLTNPSPGLGWANRERMSLGERGPADAILALALIHHLAISNNLPLPHLAAFFADLCRTLIIEWVPKSDSKVQQLLASRADIFEHYTEPAFQTAFDQHFSMMERRELEGSGRVVYLMRRREDS